MDDISKVDLVKKTLRDKRYEWRTVNGIVNDTKLSEKDVLDIINSSDDIYKSELPDSKGNDLYGLKKYSKDVEHSKKIDEITFRIANTDISDVQKVGSLVIDLLGAYNKEVLLQAKKSFRNAQIGSVLGFVIFIATILAFLYNRNCNYSAVIASIGALGGVIIEVISGLLFTLYGKSVSQLPFFQKSLDQTQRILIANSICESMDGDLKQTTRAEIVKAIIVTTQVENRNIQ